MAGVEAEGWGAGWLGAWALWASSGLREVLRGFLCALLYSLGVLLGFSWDFLGSPGTFLKLPWALWVPLLVFVILVFRIFFRIVSAHFGPFLVTCELSWQNVFAILDSCGLSGQCCGSPGDALAPHFSWCSPSFPGTL